VLRARMHGSFCYAEAAAKEVCPSFRRERLQKGAKGIAIFAPLVYKRKKDDLKPPPAEDENGNSELRGFKVVHVFDIS